MGTGFFDWLSRKNPATLGHKRMGRTLTLCYNFPAARRFPTLNPLRTDQLLSAVAAGLDDGSRALLETLTRKARQRSLPLYLVGGPVRDALLGRPVKDLDFAFEGDAIALARTLAGELGWQVVVHPRFGTASLIHRDARVDLVTARREAYDSPGALPRVVSGGIRQDLARRDFSINALALPLRGPESEVLDSHRGLDDLRQGVVRILHPGSFVDDPTRILRAVRYEQRLGFRLEPDTENRLRCALTSGAVETVSGDRLRHGLERIPAEDRPAPVLRRALDMGILAALHPAWGGQSELSRLSDALAKLETVANPLPPFGLAGRPGVSSAGPIRNRNRPAVEPDRPAKGGGPGHRRPSAVGNRLVPTGGFPVRSIPEFAGTGRNGGNGGGNPFRQWPVATAVGGIPAGMAVRPSGVGRRGGNGDGRGTGAGSGPAYQKTA